MNAIILALPFPFNSKLSSEAAFRTRPRSAGETRSLPVATRETVAKLTPATLATSSILVFAGRLAFLAILELRFELSRFIFLIQKSENSEMFGWQIYSDKRKS